MFQLRDEHLQAFGQVAAKTFEDRAVAHTRKQFPKQTSALTDDELRERIRRDIASANQAGFTSERQIMKFVDSSLLLGEDFPQDPANEWARRILADKTPADDRAAQLLDRAVQIAAKRGAA